MSLNRNSFYLLMIVACIVGYVWTFYNLSEAKLKNNTSEVCLIKHVTNVPCPSCGSTRSVLSLTQGNFVQAINYNPLGLVIAAIMLLSPFWLVFDLTTKSHSFYRFFRKMELQLKRPQYAIPLILIVVINWIWNISKGL